MLWTRRHLQIPTQSPPSPTLQPSPPGCMPCGLFVADGYRRFSHSVRPGLSKVCHPKSCPCVATMIASLNSLMKRILQVGLPSRLALPLEANACRGSNRGPTPACGEAQSRSQLQAVSSELSAQSSGQRASCFLFGVVFAFSDHGPDCDIEDFVAGGSTLLVFPRLGAGSCSMCWLTMCCSSVDLGRAFQSTSPVQ